MRVRLGTACCLVFLVLGWYFLAPTQVGGAATYVTTHGVSMQPQFSTGDFAVLRASSRYDVGDVVAYQSEVLGQLVLHRIVAEEQGRFTFKGDNNSWLDSERHPPQQVVGELLLHVRGGGLWMRYAGSFLVPGFLVLLLMGVGAGTAATLRVGRRHARSGA